MTEEERLAHCNRLAQCLVDAGIPDNATGFQLALVFEDGGAAIVTVQKSDVEGKRCLTIH